MIRDVGTLMRGTLVVQGLGLLLLPILSRLYTPASFGAFGLYQAAILLLTVIACMRYDQAILTAADDREAVALFQLSILVGLVMAALLLVPVVLIDAAGLARAMSGALSPYWLVPGMLVSGWTLAANAALTRLGDFNGAAASKMAQAGANSTASVAIGLAVPGGGPGLVLADQLSKLSAVAVAIWRLPSGVAPLLRVDFGALVRLARRFGDFPRLSVLGGLLNNGGSFLTPALIYWFYGAETAGQFALVDRTISLPLGLIIITFSQAFSSHYARLLREDARAAKPYFAALIRMAALAGLVPMVLGVLLSPYAFPLVFGAQWQEAGVFAQVLAVMYYSSLVMGPVNTALVVAGRLRWQLGWEFGRLILLVAMWAGIAGAGLGPLWALGGYAAVSVVVNFAYIWLAWAQLRQAVDAIDKLGDQG